MWLVCLNNGPRVVTVQSLDPAQQLISRLLIIAAVLLLLKKKGAARLVLAEPADGQGVPTWYLLNTR